MASLALAIATFSSFHNTPSFSSPKPPQFLHNAKRNHHFKVLCNGTKGDGNLNPNPESVKTPHGMVDRRNMLLGLGGLYGAANMIGDQVSLATTECIPGGNPDIMKCGTAIISGTDIPVPYTCCPPVPKSEVLPYKFPKNQVKRVRPAAHMVDKNYMEKYKSAIKAMKNLPADDPHNFYKQANIHCAYCNGAYPSGKIDGQGKEIPLQIHASWFFFPFHRWYLYFFEKILGTLIDDPTFALPYWNWDNPCGMTMPNMYVPEYNPSPFPPRPPIPYPFPPDLSNPLFDQYRNPKHIIPTAVVDFEYSPDKPENTPDLEKVCNNLAVMYRQMVTNGYNTEVFMGKCRTVGSKSANTKGNIEMNPHDIVHDWTGIPAPGGLGHNEDMGNFYSAAKDPIFYCHHSNVDRMWSIWSGLKPGDRNFKNKEWLDTQYFFYDENRNPVYVTVKDCIDNEKNLGYTYQPMPLPWLSSRPRPGIPRSQGLRRTFGPKLAGPNEFPVKLDKVVKISVQRVKKNRSTEEKTRQQEILVLEEIDIPSDVFVRFDIFINDDDEIGSVLSKAEFAGTFANVAHGFGKTGHRMSFNQTYGLNEILEDLEGEDDDYIQVTLIPKSGCENVTISNIKIDFSDNDTD